MKGLLPLFLGLFGTFAFSWVGLTVVPNYQIGHLDPQVSQDDENDIYPVPKSGMADRGRQIYSGNGCFYCHSEQIRPDYISSDIDRKWGDRRSAPRDYIFERPALLGKMRMGPDLSNIGKRAPAEDENAPPAGASPAPAGSPAANASPAGSPPAAVSPTGSTSSPAPSASPASAAVPANPNTSPAPAPSPAASASPAVAPEAVAAKGELLAYSAAWHHKHLYSPRSITRDSNMPAYRFLYEKRRISGELSADALKLTGKDAPPEGWEIVPTYEAKCLVAYLMSLDQSHPLKEVKKFGGTTAAALSPAPAAAAPAASPPPAPPK